MLRPAVQDALVVNTRNNNQKKCVIMASSRGYSAEATAAAAIATAAAPAMPAETQSQHYL